MNTKTSIPMRAACVVWMTLFVSNLLAQQHVSGSQTPDSTKSVKQPVSRDVPPEDKKQKKEDIANERDRLLKELKELKSSHSRLQSEHAALVERQKVTSESLDLSKENEKRLMFEKNFLSRPQTLIYDQVWSTGYMTEEEATQLVPEIRERDGLESWNANYESPSFIYHRDDKNREFGVLLNLEAIRRIKDRLEKLDLGWKIPDSSDLGTLKTNLKKFKTYRALDVLSGDRTEAPAWSKKGANLVGWGMPPLSYLMNSDMNWFGKNTASFVFINRSKDPEMRKNLSLFEIDEDPKEDKMFMLDRDIKENQPNYGAYIRLIKQSK